jgi:hypothetical protein
MHSPSSPTELNGGRRRDPGDPRRQPGLRRTGRSRTSPRPWLKVPEVDPPVAWTTTRPRKACHLAPAHAPTSLESVGRQPARWDGTVGPCSSRSSSRSTTVAADRAGGRCCRGRSRPSGYETGARDDAQPRGLGGGRDFAGRLASRPSTTACIDGQHVGPIRVGPASGLAGVAGPCRTYWSAAAAPTATAAMELVLNRRSQALRRAVRQQRLAAGAARSPSPRSPGTTRRCFHRRAARPPPKLRS